MSKFYVLRIQRGALHSRGMVLLAVLILFTVSLTLFGLWSRAVVRERASLATQQNRLQAIRLAEAGLQRAISQRASNANYTVEDWSVPNSELDHTHAAQVKIRVAPTENSQVLKFEATAEFPIGAIHHVQITKSIELPNSVPKKKS